MIKRIDYALFNADGNSGSDSLSSSSEDEAQPEVRQKKSPKKKALTYAKNASALDSGDEQPRTKKSQRNPALPPGDAGEKNSAWKVDTVAKRKRDARKNRQKDATAAKSFSQIPREKQPEATLQASRAEGDPENEEHLVSSRDEERTWKGISLRGTRQGSPAQSEEVVSSGDEEGFPSPGSTSEEVTGSEAEGEAEVEAEVSARNPKGKGWSAAVDPMSEWVLRVGPTGNVLKCRLCPRVVCLSEPSMATHLASKGHSKSVHKSYTGRLRFTLNSDGEEEEAAETHQERLQRMKDVAAVPKQNAPGPRQRQKRRKEKGASE